MTPRAGARASTTPATDFKMMSTSGIRMIRTTVQNEGSLDAAPAGAAAEGPLSASAARSGAGTKYFFPQYAPQMGPATIIAAMPQTAPTRMTQPRSTPSIVATSTGPGVGGMNAWPTARPARSGMA